MKLMNLAPRAQSRDRGDLGSCE